MLYLQLKPRAMLAPGTVPLIEDVAQSSGREKGLAALMKCPVSGPLTEGIWKISALDVARAAADFQGEISLLGPSVCYVHVTAEKKKGPAPFLRAALAFLLLMLGSALAISWFHADVDMQSAQSHLYRLLTGHAPASPWLLTIPYAAGIFAGVSFFYALPGRKKSVSPLDIKMKEYLSSLEETAGKAP